MTCWIAAVTNAVIDSISFDEHQISIAAESPFVSFKQYGDILSFCVSYIHNLFLCNHCWPVHLLHCCFLPERYLDASFLSRCLRHKSHIEGFTKHYYFGWPLSVWRNFLFCFNSQFFWTAMLEQWFTDRRLEIFSFWYTFLKRLANVICYPPRPPWGGTWICHY